MRRAAAVALLVLAAGALSGPQALAKAPSAEQFPTLDEIFQRALATREQRVREAAAAKRDARQEAIDAYAGKQKPLTDYRALTDMVNDEKTDAVQPYREKAVDALVNRFSKENVDDPQVRAVRREIALAVLELMGKPRKEAQSLQLIEKLLYAWWRPKMVSIQFHAADEQRDRRQAYNKMKRYLEREEN